jgi:hypothetical protein
MTGLLIPNQDLLLPPGTPRSAPFVQTEKKSEVKAPFLSPDEVDAGAYYEDPEYSNTYLPVQGLIFESHDIVMDATLSKDEQIRSADIGLLFYEFGSWKIASNWSQKWHEGVPPNHYLVNYRGTNVACMSPFMYPRTCPECRHGDPWDGRRYHGERLYMKHWIPRHPQTGAPTPDMLPAVAVAHRCRGPFDKGSGKLLGTCGGMDWFGSGILLGSGQLEPAAVFQRECAEELARITGDNDIADEFSAADDYASAANARDIGQTIA